LGTVKINYGTVFTPLKTNPFPEIQKEHPMRTVVRLLTILFIVFPPLVYGQQPSNPTCHAAFSADHTVGCNPMVVSFTDNSFPPAGDPVIYWHWTFGDGSSSSVANPVHTYTTPGKYSVKLVVRTQLGWTDSLKRTNYIAVNLTPEVNLGRDTAVCEGTVVTLDAGNVGATYLWSTGETTRTIQVTTADEYSVTVKKGTCEKSDTIRINPRPQIYPQYVFVVSGNGLCLPVEVKFADSSTSCPTHQIVRRQWDFGDGNTSSLQHPVHVFNSADTFIVRMTIWDETGFSMTRSKRVIIQGSPRPLVTLGNDTSVCESSQLVLNAGNPGASYNWSTGETTQTISVYNSGKISVIVSNGACSASDTINVVVKPSLIPKFGFQITGPCLPSEVKFRDSSLVCGVTIQQWQWDFGDGQTSTQQHPTHIYTQNAEYIVKLTITDNTGNSITKSKRLLIQSSSATLNLGKDTTICFGDYLTLDAGNAGANYQWSTGETTQQIMVFDDGDYSVRVDKGGCIATDTIHVATVFPIAPTFTANVIGNCLPVEVRFNDASTTRCGQQLMQWRWDFGDGQTSTQQHPVHAYTKSDTFAVRLTVTASNGMSVSKSKKVYIPNTIPVANAGVDKIVCKGQSVQLDAGEYEANYKWSPAISLTNDTIKSPIAKPEATTLYEVAVTKCMVTVTDVVQVSIAPQPVPMILKDDVKLRTTKSDSYQWYWNGTEIPKGKERTIEPEKAGYYSVEVRNNLGCSKKSDSVYFLPKGRKDRGFKGIRVRCTPNPGNGMVWVLLSKLPEKPVSITVIDRSGKPILTTTINSYANLLNLTKLAKGQYFIQLVLDKERISIPFQLQ